MPRAAPAQSSDDQHHHSDQTSAVSNQELKVPPFDSTSMLNKLADPCYNGKVPKIVDPRARRAQIAEAVFRVVGRDGLKQASLRNVAREAGLAIGSVRHYFTSHDELMDHSMNALVDQIQGRLQAHVDRILHHGPETPADRQEAIVDLLAEILPMDDVRREETLVWREFITGTRTRPRIGRHAEELFDGLRALIRRILTAARGLGTLAPGTDIELEAERLAALLDGLAVNGVTHPDRMTPALMRRVLAAHLAALHRARRGEPA